MQCRCGANFPAALLPVEQVQFLTRLETNRLARSDTDLGAGAWIAPDTGFPRPHVENSKTAQLDSLPISEGSLQRLEDCIDRGFGLVALQAGTLNHLVNDVLFNQCLPPSGALSNLEVSVEMFWSIVNVPGVP